MAGFRLKKKRRFFKKKKEIRCAALQADLFAAKTISLLREWRGVSEHTFIGCLKYLF